MTKKQQEGGFLGTLLASIGVSLVMKMLTGSGSSRGHDLQIDPSHVRNSRSVYVPKPKSRGGYVNSSMLMTPPFYGNWSNTKGCGIKKGSEKKVLQKRVKKQKAKGLLLGKTVLSTISQIFVNKPLSNIDLSQWIEKLGIRYFRGIYSRDNLPNNMMKKECGIINLDTQIGPGTQWVCYRNIDSGYCEYFDSFGFSMPRSIESYRRKSGKQLI